MNKKPVLSIGKRLLSRALLTLITCTFVCDGYAQILTDNHYFGIGAPFTFPTSFPYDIKNVSICRASDSQIPPAPDFFPILGTAFQNGYVDATGTMMGKGAYFSMLDGLGQPMSCGAYGSSANHPITKIYDDPNYPDERGVTPVYVRLGTWALTILIVQVRNAAGNYGMKILTIENCPYTITRDEVYMDDLYPMDAVYNPYDGNVYICGKKGVAFSFIAKYNPLTGGLIAIADSWIPTTPTSYEFNNYIHIKILEKGVNQGNLAVTGSCVVEDANGAPVSGAFAGIYDQNLNLGNRVSVIDPASTLANGNADEYAYDINENDDGSFYLYSNKFDRGNSLSNPFGYYPTSKHPVITYLDADLQLSTTAARRVNILPPVDNTNWAWGKTLLTPEIIAGYVSHWDPNGLCSTLGHHAPASDNILPFLGSVTMGWNGSSISATINYWKTYFTKSKTTTFGPMGGVLSNPSWPTKMATRVVPLGFGALAFTAPLWNDDFPVGSPANKLTYKFTSTDINGNVDPGGPYPCDKTNTDCKPITDTTSAYNGEPVTRWLGIGLVSNMIQGNSQEIPNTTIGRLFCPFTGHYKPTIIDNTIPNAIPEIKVYPNPAHDHVSIETHNLPGDADVKIDIINVTGQKVQELYNGKSAGLNSIKKFDLNLAPGMYFIKITSGENEISQQKLVIQ